jgi:OmcA/MtrC family decaheme c-type cytochrome
MKPARALLTVPLLLLVAACGGGSSSSSPPPDPPDAPTELQPGDDPPGIVLTIDSVFGGSNSDGSFRPGDHVKLRFRLEKRDGTRWNLHEMRLPSALVSGPSFNYQRLIAEQSDVLERAVEQSDGSWLYTFAAPLPAQYLAPLNDSSDPQASEGELTGQDLLDGTATAGLALCWDYEIAGRSFRDAGNATFDLRLGASAVLAPRALVSQETCDRCHISLRYHEGRFREVGLCLLCHTSGAEDANDPAIAGGTPGVSIDFRVLMHKLHNGRHLPSVLGVTSIDDGTRDYTAAPVPLQYARPDGTLADFSHVGYPVWPNRTLPTLRDFGWSSLPPEARAAEDTIRTGVADCLSCHGDPDGAGPLPAPAQGLVAYSAPSRRACGACHDDIRWEFPYVSNQTGTDPPGMPAQLDDSLCKTCHVPDNPDGDSGNLTVPGGHLHPLFDPFLYPPFLDSSLNAALVSVSEAGTNNGDGHIDPGEKLQISFSFQTDAGVDIPASSLTAIEAVVAGPTSNSNLVLATTIPKALLTGTQPYSLPLPAQQQLELVGRSTATTGETFTSNFAPHLNVAGALTTVFTRTAILATTTLAAATHAPQNFVDVADAGGFARDDVVAAGEGTGTIEYARVQLVEGNRLWFSSPATPAYPPGLALAHAAGVNVSRVTLTQKIANVDYSLDAASGTITELVEFGAGVPVLMSYWSDFVMPASYGLALHDSPDLGETSGKWSGKSLVAGTYTLTLWGYRTVNAPYNGQSNTYFSASQPAKADFLSGSASVLEPYSIVSSATNCYACHQQIWYHEGRRRGFESCIACHGTAGAEDLPPYVAANAPQTSGATTSFRTLLHQIHRGSQMAQAASFELVTSGSAAYPDNYGLHSYADYLFPALPGRTTNCAKCHGAGSSSWIEPAARDHPTEQGAPVLAWRAVCGACHDKSSDLAHYQTQTSSSGLEACATCHGPGTQLAVELVHKAR